MKPTEIYFCYLNGQFYGRGTLDFMRELFVDYVITNKIYGKNEVTFQIFKEGEA